MRVFIAYSLPKKFKEQLAGFQYRLQRRAISLKAYPTQNLHLTTAFLGEIPNETKNPLIKIVKTVNQKTKEMSLKTTSFSGFPRPERAGTLILKVGGQDIKKLKKARGFLQQLLKRGGFWVDQKSFVPHITLGRVKRPLNLEQLKVEAPGLKFSLDKMHVFKSTLTDSGPIYQQLS